MEVMEPNPINNKQLGNLCSDLKFDLHYLQFFFKSVLTTCIEK